MSNWIYYIVIMTLNGSQNIEIARFDSIDKCETYMRTNHKRLKGEYFQEAKQRMTGSGCRPVPSY